MMTIEYHPYPEQFLGTGTVFIAWEPAETEPDGSHYWGYWDSIPETLPGKPLEETPPRTHAIDEAIEWGRPRTSRVLVRPESDPDEYYWAGTGEPRGGDADLKRLVL